MAAVCLHAAPVFAQRVAGPYEGIFGAGGQREVPQLLELRASVFGAFDDVNDLTDSDEGALASGTGPGVEGGLVYRRRTDAVTFSVAGNSEVRMYPKSDNSTASTHSGSTLLELKLGTRIVTRATGSGTYSSFYQFAPFLDAATEGVGDAATGGVGPLTPGFGFASAAQRNTRLVAGAGAVLTLTRRSTFSADVDWSDWRFLDRPDLSVETRGGRGTLMHELTRALSLRAGYGYLEGRYNFAGNEPVTIRTIDVGVDYRDTLEFARRTALAFATSTSALKYEGDTHYRVEGSAVLTRGFRRTWSTSLAYDRNTRLTAGFRQPILADSVHARIGGLLSGRVRWATGAGYSRGEVGFGSGSGFTTYSGGSRLEFALTERLALYGQYAYYRYRVPVGSSAADSVSRFARQTAIAGLKLWVPIVGR